LGAIVQFDYAVWAARYPELATSVAEPLAQSYFAEATIYQANDGSGPVRDSGQQLALLNMLTAHIAKLNAPIGGVESPQLVGRISNASQGSVSGATSYVDPKTDLQAWANQTKYGANWYSATSQYRTFRYRGGPRRFFSPWPAWPFQR